MLRREGAPALPYGNKQAPGCPVPGVAAGAARRVNHWRLDRERLAAVTAAVAPGITVSEARNDPDRCIEGPASARTGNRVPCDPPLTCPPVLGPACGGRAFRTGTRAGRMAGLL